MNNYRTGDIRNIAVLGGSGSGKTTLVEAAAFAGENKNYLGSIAQGNTVSDYDSEERSRGFSIHLSVVPVEWNGYKINFLDAPGALDFEGERESAASAADAAVIVINARKGIDAGTCAAWKLCDRYKLPRVIFVTGMDDDTASYREIVEDKAVRRKDCAVSYANPPGSAFDWLCGYYQDERQKIYRYRKI